MWWSAYDEAHKADKAEYAEEFIRSALIGSQALLLGRNPSEALCLLDTAGAAAAWVRQPIGSDHFRQRGVALFQLREDDAAADCFRKAVTAMEHLNEARNPAQLVMTGPRHINLLGKLQWDGAREVLDTAKRGFGETSLEAVMAQHWAAACGLSTDSTRVNEDAVRLLDAPIALAPQFGHQATIRKLLALTPDLGLDTRLRQAWVRRALYENASRTR